ncbi:MAG: hypothetical protein ACFFE6_10310 [Candidatus Thorarchaeota archaeon]
MEKEIEELFGIECVRARFHGDLVWIEVGRDERKKLFDERNLDDLHKLAISAGFKYVAIDALGYRTGAMNEVLVS